MIYIIGSGFSGLTTAYALTLIGKKVSIISPQEDFEKKNFSLIKYLFKRSGEIQNNSKYLSKIINRIDNFDVLNCKYIQSHSVEALSGIWGGVLSDIYNYKVNNFLINKNKIFKYNKEFVNLKKIIGFPKEEFKNIKTNEIINYKNYIISKKNTNKLKKYLISKKVHFINDNYVTRIDYKNNLIKAFNIKKKIFLNLDYEKIFVSCGPINTSKLLINSLKKIKEIKVRETQHFYTIVKIKEKLKSKFFNFNYKNIRFSCQLYTPIDALKIFYNKNKFNNFLNKKNYFIGQCYLDSKKSGIIKVKKKEDKIIIKGYENKIFHKSKIKKILSLYNKSNKEIEFVSVLFNKVGASNHLGASLPMTKDRKIKLGVNINGKLNHYDNIYICDSSVISEIDTTPITLFSMHNILRMILSNKKL